MPICAQPVWVGLFALTAGGLMVAAAASDIRHRRIPNSIPVLLIAVFALAWIVAPQTALEQHLASFVLLGAIGLFLYFTGVWGGGDAKLLGSIAIYMPLAAIPRLLLVTALAGGMIGVVMLATRRFRRENEPHKSLPYGVALAAGGIVGLVHGC